MTYTADEPDQLRGPQHDHAWCDELAAWKYPEAFDQLLFGLRLGDRPQVLVTTTPRPIGVIKDLIKDEKTVVSRGSTYENRGNLAPAFLDKILSKYEGTRLGRQEIEGAVLEDTPGALWANTQLESARVASLPDWRRIIVSIDPATTASDQSAETGIIVCALGLDGLGYVLEDLSGKYSPAEWANKSIAALRRHKADRIVAEVNQGGDMVESTLRAIDKTVPYRGVHACRGKRLRAEPIAALYEKGRVKHVRGLAALEDQMTTWDASDGSKSPDRVDALVHGLTDLLLTATAASYQRDDFSDYLPSYRS